MFVADRIGRDESDQVVRPLADAIPTNNAVTLPEHIQSRRVQRRFKRATGVSMHTLKAIRRFRSVFDCMQTDSDESWVERALESGYFDQPQMVRDYRPFLGCRAREWVESGAGLGLAIGTD